jgi:hypothetical protein
MLQKLPKTEGDSIKLGLITAIGITSNTLKNKASFFATFELEGELITYELPNISYYRAFIEWLDVMAERIYDGNQIREMSFRKLHKQFILDEGEDSASTYDD